MSTDLQLAIAVLDAGLRSDEDTFNQALNQIAEDDGWTGLFAACCGYANALHQLQPVAGDPADLIGFDVVNAQTGETVSPEQADLPPSLIAATRLIVAVGNKDFPAANAAFQVEIDTDRGQDTVCWVLALVIAGIQRHPKFNQVYGRPA